MACGCAGAQHAVPWMRAGLPTVYAWGPFEGYEPVEYDLENNGTQEEQVS